MGCGQHSSRRLYESILVSFISAYIYNLLAMYACTYNHKFNTFKLVGPFIIIKIILITGSELPYHC